MANVNDTFGSWFVGVEVSLVAFGFSILQCWLFFQQWRKERFILKLVVALTLVLGFVLVFLTSHALYYYLVTSITNPAALKEIIWSFKAEPWVSEAIVTLTHLFYILRIFFINKSYILCGVLIILTFSHTVLDYVAAGLELSVTGLAAEDLTARLAEAGLSLDLVTDVIIMFAMFHFFYTSRTQVKSTQNLLNKLAMYTFASGFITVVANAVILATFLTQPTSQIYSGASFVLPHLYSNCLLAVLNSRKSLRDRYDTGTIVGGGSSSLPGPSLPVFTLSSSQGTTARDTDSPGASELFPMGNTKGEPKRAENYVDDQIRSVNESVRNDGVFAV
ncbi:hypothetical protein M422DRAFT_273004 [Sphaerobolus stellatus SS14]|uniref:DUF6534 domain-containing protein n=1 Tax=Sphaerobolus stellatus (strain SS14) TaxID=990650 RepID=A0A0C9UAA3_SPHS4|nr:hypothetical protein M422DRAFT_273004 [Sphaerobolus stellatus SS14]